MKIYKITESQKKKKMVIETMNKKEIKAKIIKKKNDTDSSITRLISVNSLQNRVANETSN